MKDGEPDLPESRDDVATLIRLAGRRRPAPQDRSARVKAVAREHWQREVQERRRRWRVWTVSSLAAAASLVLMSIRIMRFVPGAAPSGESLVTVESVKGTAWIDDALDEAAPRRRLLETHAPVPGGAAVTTGEDSLLALRLASGYSVRLDAGTRLRLLDPGALALDLGAVYVDSGRSGGAAGTGLLTVQTPLGRIQELGTQFEVRLQDGAVRVRVREGLVTLDDGGQVHEVPVARQLTLREDGSVTIQRIPTHGPDWDWMAEVAAVPDLAGLSARAFLEWVARERGWRLRFVRDDLGRFAGEIVLSGSAERLTLEQALDAVLQTCGMAHRVEDGDLIIEPLATDPLPE